MNNDIENARRKMESEIFSAVERAWGEFTAEHPSAIVNDIFIEMMDDDESLSRPVNVEVFLTVVQ